MITPHAAAPESRTRLRRFVSIGLVLMAHPLRTVPTLPAGRGTLDGNGQPSTGPRRAGRVPRMGAGACPGAADDRFMPRPSACPAAAALLLALAAAVGGCGLAPEPSDVVGCTLDPVHGVVVAAGSGVALDVIWGLNFTPSDRPFILPLAWPHGWSVRSTGSGAEVVDRQGQVFARTGDTITITAQADPDPSRPGWALYRDGAFVACP